MLNHVRHLKKNVKLFDLKIVIVYRTKKIYDSNKKRIIPPHNRTKNLFKN